MIDIHSDIFRCNYFDWLLNEHGIHEVQYWSLRGYVRKFLMCRYCYEVCKRQEKRNFFLKSCRSALFCSWLRNAYYISFFDIRFVKPSMLRFLEYFFYYEVLRDCYKDDEILWRKKKGGLCRNEEED